jgi:hypothetical protein
MGAITAHCGQPSYTISNRHAELRVSVQGGHLTADFAAGGKKASPFWVAPWWKEPYRDGDDWIVRLLRGDFFCLPFGGNGEPFGGTKYTLHGKTASECWELLSRDTAGGTLALRMDCEPGEVVKTIRLEPGAPVIYQSHRVSGLAARMPVGHHPTLWCGDEPGAAFVDISEPLAGFTLPAPVGVPETQGYGLLAVDTAITDRTRVPTVYGTVADLTRYPVRRGHEDGVQYLCDPGKEFAFTSVAFPSRGYLYFNLKDPRVLCSTVFWMCDGGRYGAPFSGRATGVLGAEETTGYFFAGIKTSVEANPLQQKGFRTFLDFSAAKPTDIRLIMGVAPIGSDFRGVADIVRKDGSTITIRGRGGEKIDLACRADFLAEK